MAITSLNDYINAVKQRIEWVKTPTARTTVIGNPFSMFDLAGQPGAGTLAGTSTTAPVLPTDATAGCPTIVFSSGIGYISKIEYNNTVASRLALFDMLSKSGAYSYAAGTTTITSQLDSTSRMPDYSAPNGGYGNELWIEVSTAFVTGTAWQVQVTYVNQGGGTSTSVITAAAAAAALTLGKMIQLPLAAGDSGVQALKSVIVTNGATAMTAGAFNVLILRSLWTSGRIPIANGGDIHDMLKTGLPQVYTTSALFVQVCSDTTSTGLPEINIEIASA